MVYCMTIESGGLIATVISLQLSAFLIINLKHSNITLKSIYL